MKNRTYERCGFTLVETIFSTLFISLTVLAIINLFPGAYLSVKKSETQLQCDMVANSIVEELRATPFTQLATSGTYARTGSPFETQTVDGVSYSPKVTLFDVPDTDSKFVRGVRVEVTYRVRTSSHTTVYETYLHSLIR
jgi:Tfp pilus assembly protein PilV